MKKLLLLLLLSLNLHAETIEFVVPSSPGVGDDIASRKIAQKLLEVSKLEIIVLNKPGASKIIGYNYIKDSHKPTLLVSSDTIFEHKVKDLIEPLYFLGDSSNLVMVSSTSNINSIEDLILLSHKREIRFGHGGETSQGYKAGSLLCQKLVLNCLSVPYKSGPEATIGVLNNTVDFFAIVAYGSENLINNNKFKILMLMTSTGHPLYNVPLLTKKYKDLEFQKWTMLFGKNINENTKEVIINTLKNLPDSFFANELGFWYSYKDPLKVYNDKP